MIPQDTEAYYRSAVRNADTAVRNAEAFLTETMYFALEAGMSADLLAELVDSSRATVYRRVKAYGSVTSIATRGTR
jgi:hypothetical protein